MKFRSGLQNLILELVYKKSFKAEENILICANPRGGSTWLEQVFSSIENTMTIYEPLNPAYAKKFTGLGFSHRQFLSENEPHESEFKAFNQLFTGKYLEKRAVFHPNSNNSVIKILNCNKLVFKFCRMNLMLPWITKTFNLRPPVFLLRNPFAQISSQMEFGSVNKGNWTNKNFDLSAYAFDKPFPEYKDYLKNLTGTHKVLAALWALTNKIPLEHEASNKRWINISYESLFNSPEENFVELFSRMNLKFKKSYLKNIHESSKTTISKVDLKKWQKSLTEIQIKEISEVLDHLGMYKYYEDQVLPKIDISSY